MAYNIVCIRLQWHTAVIRCAQSDVSSETLALNNGEPHSVEVHAACYHSYITHHKYLCTVSLFRPNPTAVRLRAATIMYLSY
jgi:hypothetical protein